MDTSESARLFREASRVMVGGVSSPVRSFSFVGGTPLFIARGEGANIWDADGNRYVDYVCSWGPLILGHCDREVVDAVIGEVRRGTSFGAPTVPELELARRICSSIPSVERVRFVNSGTEAAMSALRLARGYTSRAKFLKFDGCYHGHADPFLTRAGSGLATQDLPSSAGVPAEASAALTLPYNDEGALEEAFRDRGSELAAAIVEPVAGNMGVVLPEPGFLERLRKLCTEHGALLIFDEVITGFRVSPGGAQGLYGVRPDITCLGKVIGGGFPVGAYGGRAEVMRLVSPEGPVYQAGTLSGNPVAMAAGLATISKLDGAAYRRLEGASARLEEGIVEGADSAGVDVTVNRVGSMVGLFFGPGKVRDYSTAKASSHRAYPRFHKMMLEAGAYLPPSPFETIFLSTAHSDEDVDATVAAAGRAFKGAGD
ncbi:MAG: glutamate-1-semialdehyde 2,1-aminomutase [Nitrososphaerota archaeon]|jgi:glutamate-1-semialdehyde 2,1-aminomutase|nr:glutamate-1-semialdehyde 2,1-aminomutase [Nitrososphaerota archaeon]